MGQRLQLQTLLESQGAKKVYFQPPPTLTMEYPAIVYVRDNIQSNHAGNLPYFQEDRYLLTVIDRNPDSDIPGAIARLPKCSFERGFRADQLNHSVFNIYF